MTVNIITVITNIVIVEVAFGFCLVLLFVFIYLSEAMFVPTLYNSSNWSLKDTNEQSNFFRESFGPKREEKLL